MLPTIFLSPFTAGYFTSSKKKCQPVFFFLCFWRSANPRCCSVVLKKWWLPCFGWFWSGVWEEREHLQFGGWGCGGRSKLHIKLLTPPNKANVCHPPELRTVQKAWRNITASSFQDPGPPAECISLIFRQPIYYTQFTFMNSSVHLLILCHRVSLKWENKAAVPSGISVPISPSYCDLRF